MAVRRQRENRAVAVVALLVMLVAACGTTAGPPEHFTRVETGWMTIDIPEDWVPVEVDDEPWTEGYADASDDSATVLLVISPTYSEMSTARGATSAIVIPSEFTRPGFRIVPSEEGTNDDFMHRHFTRFIYSGADGKDFEGIVWGVANDAQRAVVVQLTGETLDEELVATIGNSIKIVKD